MLLTALGGGWFPLEITGPAFQTVAHLQPTAWILDAFHGIILKGWDLTQVLPAVGVTLAYVLVCFAVSIWRFRFE